MQDTNENQGMRDKVTHHSLTLESFTLAFCVVQVLPVPLDGIQEGEGLLHQLGVIFTVFTLPGRHRRRAGNGIHFGHSARFHGVDGHQNILGKDATVRIRIIMHAPFHFSDIFFDFCLGKRKDT